MMRWLVGMGLVLLCAPACTPQRSVASEPRVINGKKIGEKDFAAVVEITRHTKIGDDEAVAQVCTGTFIAERIVITAAHCITDRVSADGFVNKPGAERIGGKIPSRIFVHPEYQWSSGFDPLHDVALMEFASDLAPAVAHFSPQPAKAGDAVEIVGFGRLDPNDNDSAGVKRWGANTLETAGETLTFKGLAESRDLDGKDTASARGDSGGPMFLAGALIGTTVGGAVDEGRKISQYTHLHAAGIKRFLAQARARGFVFDLPATLAN